MAVRRSNHYTKQANIIINVIINIIIINIINIIIINIINIIIIIKWSYYVVLYDDVEINRLS